MGILTQRDRLAAPGRAPLGRYLVAASLARLADDGARVALILLAIDQTGSTSFGGLLVACLLVPHVVAAPVTGALADRSTHRLLFQAAALVLFGSSLVAIAVVTGAVANAVPLLIAAAGGCVGPMITGGLTSLLRDYVPEPQRDRAYGLDIVTYTTAGIVGPAVAAFLAQLFSPAAATIALGSCALMGGVVLLTLGPPDRAASSGDAPPWRSLLSADAILVMWRDRALRSVTVASSIGAAGFSMLPLAAVLRAEETQHAILTGLCVAASATGALLGSALYARHPFGTQRPAWTAVVCLAAIALPFALVIVVPGAWAILGLVAFAGLPTGPLGSSVFLVRDHQSPAAVHTQVFTLGAGLKMSSGAIGTAVAGFVAGIGSSGVFLLMAGLHVVAAVIGALILRRATDSVRDR